MRTLGPLVLVALAVVAGCGAPETRTPSTLPQPKAAIPVEVTEAKADAIAVTVAGHRGKVVLMDFWATWCPPCRETFPDFVDEHKAYADKGLVCVSVSMDKTWERARGSYNRAGVLEFLTANKATFPNFVSAETNDDPLRDLFGLGDSIPFQALLNKQGERVWTTRQKRLSGPALHKLIEAELAK